ncbi:hypothetical protein [Granulicella mallensis]|uniref:hypothetical protein n=1 Tax=Granulicella mallensis TaxID=940614 RepID=UPI0012374DBD|nr:hypothetical protein [Granulicella mallensis]
MATTCDSPTVPGDNGFHNAGAALPCGWYGRSRVGFPPEHWASEAVRAPAIHPHPVLHFHAGF